jgi:hypothetical protein
MVVGRFHCLVQVGMVKAPSDAPNVGRGRCAPVAKSIKGSTFGASVSILSVIGLGSPSGSV